ncbi:MAG TPA: hypothetical protein VEC18_03705 [Myxococcota bacterium]|nr:hypothetical protein [Myxococcota bacterium]
MIKYLRSVRHPAALLFFGTWIAYGLLINSANLRAYTLQQRGVESLVERGTFALPGAGGDVVKVGDQYFANKQPAQFTLGAAVYWMLHRFGLSYAKDYDLASALVTWLSSSSMCALSVALIFLVLHDLWGLSKLAAIAAALSYGFASTAFAYSGVAHHDIIGVAVLGAGFYCLERLLRAGTAGKRRLAVLAGALVTLTSFASLLGAFSVGLVASYGFFRLPARHKPAFAVGLALGCIPFGVYNHWLFGNPLTTAVHVQGLAGHFTRLQPEAFAANLHNLFLFGEPSVLKYNTTMIFGVLGLFLLPGLRKQTWLIGCIVLLQALFIANTRDCTWAGGNCQYGARYLLPCYFWASFGIAGIAERRGSHPILALHTLLAWIYASLVNLLGALRGSMYCGAAYVPAIYLRDLFSKAPPEYPLLAPLSLSVLAGVGLVVLRHGWKRVANRGTHEAP